MSAYLYIIAHPQGWRKIGYSSDPHVRINQHQRFSGAPLKGEFLFSCTNPKEFEKRVHETLASKRITGEWFNVGREEALNAVKSATGLDEREFDKLGRPWTGGFQPAITADQFRMAKAALELSNPALGEIAKLHKNTLNKIDRGEPIKESTMMLLRSLFEQRGIVFIDENGGGAGVRFAEPKEAEDQKQDPPEE